MWRFLLVGIILSSQSARANDELRLSVPSGLSLLGNPFATDLLVRSVITDPPEGLEVYTFDSTQQQYRVTQFSFGKWTDADHLLAANAGAYIRNPAAPFEISLAGPEIAQAPELRAGLNLIAVAGPDLLEDMGKEGDVIHRRVGTVFASFTNRLGAWAPTLPPMQKGEGFFIRRNEPAASCGGGAVLFNNYVPGLVNERVLARGCNVVSGPEWKAQLVLYTQEYQEVPLGVPVPFLTGAASGYLDISSRAVICVPGVQPGGNARVLIRFWRGETFEEASSKYGGPYGFSELLEITLGGELEPPAPLAGLAFRAPPPHQPFPPGVAAFEGKSAEFRLLFEWPTQLQWQKEGANGIWFDLPGQTNPIITISPLSLSDAGNYRVSWFDFCAHESPIAKLSVRPWPAEKIPGAVDPSFQTRWGGIKDYLATAVKVFAVAVGPSDEIFAGGHFTEVNGKLWNGLARLRADGSLDESFQPPLFNPFGSQSHIDAHQIFVQTDGTVWTGFGTFSLRFRSDGTPLPYLITNVSYPDVRLIYPDGRTLVHSSLSPSSTMRFSPDAVLDPAFSPFAGPPQLLLRNQKILQSARERRLPNGSLDNGFTSPILSGATQFLERPNGQIYVAGQVRLAGSTNTTPIVRLNIDGSLDDSFVGDPRLAGTNHVIAMALQPNGKILLGGLIDPIPRVSGRGLVRLNLDGSLDSSFKTGQGIAEGNDEPYIGPRVLGLAVQRDGDILVAGDFQKFDDVARDGLVRLFGDPVSPLELSANIREGRVELQIFGSEDLAQVEQSGTVDFSEWRELGKVHLGETGSATLSAPTNQSNSFFRVKAAR